MELLVLLANLKPDRLRIGRSRHDKSADDSFPTLPGFRMLPEICTAILITN